MPPLIEMPPRSERQHVHDDAHARHERHEARDRVRGCAARARNRTATDCGGRSGSTCRRSRRPGSRTRRRPPSRIVCRRNICGRIALGCRLSLTDDGGDLGVRRKPPRFFLGKDEVAVHAHLENAAVALDELRRNTRVLPKRSLQPGGLRQVVSTDAVFDGEAHCSMIACRLASEAGVPGRSLIR